MDTTTPAADPEPSAVRSALEEARREAAAAERRRLAQALHDTVAQSLTAIYFVTKQIEIQLGNDRPELSGKFASLGAMIRQASGELHACTQGPESGGPPPSGHGDASAGPGSLPAAPPGIPRPEGGS